MRKLCTRGKKVEVKVHLLYPLPLMVILTHLNINTSPLKIWDILLTEELPLGIKRCFASSLSLLTRLC